MIAPPRHNILIPGQPVFDFTRCCVFSGEAENTNFIDFGSTRLGHTHDLLHLMQA
jgi:hypothetical protein